MSDLHRTFVELRFCVRQSGRCRCPKAPPAAVAGPVDLAALMWARVPPFDGPTPPRGNGWRAFVPRPWPFPTCERSLPGDTADEYRIESTPRVCRRRD